MSYTELSLKGFVSEVRDVSSGQHPRKFCFLLGAGASRTSGIPSGQELVKQWDQELLERNAKNYDTWKKELGITEENQASFYSHYYSVLRRAASSAISEKERAALRSSSM